ncbi:unnamed protein product [Caenorhabditis angaria]|uniref:Uncharacterized protein n=1 Tax=Caenorhabditis angaria TaxID=860376 RepID=A0A9P1J0K2_9PELO|nr:unnamed protein product [Caenorhabditis angaria]
MLNEREKVFLSTLFQFLKVIYDQADIVEHNYPFIVFDCYADLIISYGETLFSIDTHEKFEEKAGSLRDDILNLYRSTMIFVNRNEPPAPEIFEDLFGNRNAQI